jgi:hypothetical protein
MAENTHRQIISQMVAIAIVIVTITVITNQNCLHTSCTTLMIIYSHSVNEYKVMSRILSVFALPVLFYRVDLVQSSHRFWPSQPVTYIIYLKLSVILTLLPYLLLYSPQIFRGKHFCVSSFFHH